MDSVLEKFKLHIKNRKDLGFRGHSIEDDVSQNPSVKVGSSCRMSSRDA